MPRGFLVKRYAGHPLSTSVHLHHHHHHHPLHHHGHQDMPLPLIKARPVYRSYSDEDRSDSSVSDHEVPLNRANPKQLAYRGSPILYGLPAEAPISSVSSLTFILSSRPSCLLDFHAQQSLQELQCISLRYE